MGAQSSERHLQNRRTRRAGFDLGSQQLALYTATTTLGNNHGELVQFNATGGAFTIYLPPKPYDGMTFHFSEAAGNATALTVDGNSKSINGAATLTMNAAYRQRKLRYSSLASQWIIVGGI